LGLAERSPKWRPQNGGQARERIHGEKAMGALEKWREGKVRQGQGCLCQIPGRSRPGRRWRPQWTVADSKGRTGGAIRVCPRCLGRPDRCIGRGPRGDHGRGHDRERNHHLPVAHPGPQAFHGPPQGGRKSEIGTPKPTTGRQAAAAPRPAQQRRPHPGDRYWQRTGTRHKRSFWVGSGRAVDYGHHWVTIGGAIMGRRV
jgi:hypothetical protein